MKRSAPFVTVLVSLLLVAPAVAAGPTEDRAPYDDALVQWLATDPLVVDVIVMTEGPPAPVAARAELQGFATRWTFDIIDGFAGTVPTIRLDAVARLPGVASVHLDAPMAPVMDVSHRAIEADKAWAAGLDGSGITVAVLDTGIDQVHPFFTGAVVSCVSTIGGITVPECSDNDGHGTHVAGTVASRDDTYPGIAPGATLAIVRVLHAVGNGLSSDSIAGMNWVRNNANNVNPPIRAATMSVGPLNPGCGSPDNPSAQAANNLVASGIPFTVAAGNAGHDECTVDGAAAAADVITVAAVDDRETVTQNDDIIASFSSGGSPEQQKPDIAFPGVDITSAFIGGGALVATLSGTSMATPHAAGVMALLFDQDPGRSAADVKDRITQSAVKTSNTGNQFNLVYGHGLGNACRALQLNTCGGGPVNQPPTASFTFDCTELSCSFDGTGSSDGDGSIVSYDWDLGDGNTATGATTSHTYAAGGTYAVTLTVTDDDGATDAASQDVTVTGPPPPNEPPTASFTVSCTDLTCDFTDTSTDGDGSVVSWDWDFGDGATSTTQNPSHTYAVGGTYTVTLTVTDDDGATDAAGQDVTVTEPPPISLTTNGYKVRGQHHIDLSWSGATSPNVDIYRDGVLLATTANDGAYTDATGNKGKGSYTHQVCEAGTSTCSAEVTTTF